MEQRIRNTAGFYNGAGVTPAPSPVPTTDQATYRVVEWNGATVKVLCDKYGRLFVWKDTTSDNIVGVAWTAEGIDQTFDNIDQHEQAFTEIIHTYGYNDAVRRYGVDNYVIEIGGEEVEFSFQDGQLVPVASQWQQGATPMFFYRTLNDGTNDVTVVCAPDGKLYVNDDDGYLIKGQNGYAWSIGAAPQALVTNAGGKVTMDAYTDEDETTIISMDGYTVVIDLDGLVTVGAITEWLFSNLVRSIQVPYSGGNVNIPVDKYGRVMVKHDGNVNYTPWWVEGNQIALFDDAADQVLVNAMRDHGYVDCLSFTQVSNITVTIDGQSENLVFNSETKKFNMYVPEWLNAEVNLLYRSFTLTGGAEISAVIDADSGRLAIVRNGGNDNILKVVFDGSEVQALEMDLLSNYPDLSDMPISRKLLEFFESSIPEEGDTDVLANTVGSDIFVIVLNQDGEYREGSARVPTNLPPSPTPHEDKAFYRFVDGIKWLVDKNGHLVVNSDVSKPCAWFDEGLGWTAQTNSSKWPDDIETLAVPMTLNSYPGVLSASFTVSEQSYLIEDDGRGFQPTVTQW